MANTEIDYLHGQLRMLQEGYHRDAEPIIKRLAQIEATRPSPRWMLINTNAGDPFSDKIHAYLAQRRAAAESDYLARNPDVLANPADYECYVQGTKTYIGKKSAGFEGAELVFDAELNFTGN